ncbi:hypothetical protein Smp_134120 [Schistosoma mansoni]|uniref:hypothetical protein n=1 Tax=Schistosoma mansoni TaxID=6183 RepID=UPI00022C8178|nr:hypothetical protein Smp_134120 [Schistosoma mansoni]|eukprot:XP_018647378.1 hypothetical protein Smp_134120 [Schistosoma mansoni]
MPFPEPIPSYFDFQPSTGPSYQFRSIEDVNNVIQMLLWKVSQEHRYTGLGCIQEELFRHYPSAINFIASIRMNADCIPRLAEHKKLIQRVNTHLWAYATTRNVLTLADMEQLIQLEAPNDYRLLGPVVRLPAALEILQVSEFDQRVVACFTTGSTNQAMTMCTEDVLKELKTCICKNRYRLPTNVSRGSVYSWWESVFTEHMLGVLDNFRVVQHSNQYQKLDQLAKYGIRIKGFSHLVQEITNNLKPENLSKAGRLAQDQLDNDIRQLYKDFASSLMSKSALKSMKPVNVLKRLATYATRLHDELQSWAEARSLVWPKGHLDSLLVFGQFMQRIAATGPFRTLVHLLILLFNTESMNIKELLTQVVSSVRKADRVLESSSQSTSADNRELIDLTADPDDELCEISPKLDDAITTKYPKLTEIVDKFNNLLRQQQQQHEEEEGNVVDQSNNLWLSLASLEREIFPQIIGQNSQSLLSLLVEAINDGVNNVNLFPLNVIDIRKDKIPDENSYSESSPGKVGVLHEESSTSRDIDPGLVFDFVQKLTCISSRSKEELCKLVCEHLHIIRSSKLEQLIESILSQIMDDHEMNKVQPLVYHHHVHLPNILTMEEIQQSMNLQSSSSDIISRLLTRRECVISFLSACPSLMDLEAWSQWYQDCLFYDRWGSLDSFLIEAGAEQVCDQYNLLAIRILPFDGAVVGNNNQLLRLTAHPSPNDLKNALEKWRYNRNSLTIRLVGDYLIGSVIKASRLKINEACSIITNHFTTTTTISKNVSDSNEWIYFVYSLLMKLPYSLLGLVFSLIIIPSLELSGIRCSISWPLDKSDISLMNNNDSSIHYSLLHIFFNDELLSLNTCIDENHSQLNRINLISAIGSIGYQLKWPAYIKYFEENRFKLIDIPDQMNNIDITCQLPTITILPSSFSETQFTTEDVDDHDHNQASSCLKLLENNEDISTNVPIQSNNVNTNVNDICKSTTQLDKDMTIADSKNLSSDRHQFIEEIRRREFGVGVELSEEATDLIQRVEGKLSRSLVQLSEELYGLPGHFLLELIQNADDNTYGINDTPTLQLQLSTISTMNNECNSNINGQKFSLLVMNNESVGFTEHDMSALCDIGQSTKVTQRDAKIGRKGIGFKSVFNITDTPEVHSNGFHVRFHRQSKCTKYTSQTSPSLILIPEWCDNEQLMKSQNSCNEIPSWCKTLFILPLNSETLINRSTRIVQSPALYITQLIQTTLHPSLMLFLRRLQCLRFSSMESNIYWNVKRTIKTLSSSSISLGISVKIQCSAEIITVHETQCNLSSDGETNTIHKWFCFKEIIPVDFKETNKKYHWLFHSNDSDPLQPCAIFSYLPIRSVGFRFFINADFDLTSSREDVDSTSAWNRWLVGKIPNIFSDMIECIEKSTSSNHSELILLRLLIDYLQIYEPHPELLIFSSHHRRLSMKSIEIEDTMKDMTNVDDIIDKYQSTDYVIDRNRIDALHWLGAQTISIESLLNLATNLKPEDINRPGLLSVLMSSFDACLTTYNTPTSNWSSQLSLSSKPSIAISRRRLLTALQHLPIFPLTNGQCIRLNDKQKHFWSNDIHPVVLLPPSPSEIASMLIGITYDDYIQLIEKLGPIIKPDAFQLNQINYHKDYSTLLTDQSPIGLGIQIAYPSIVLTKWIIPYLKLKQSNDHFMEVSMIQMNWYITVAQFYALIHLNISHCQTESINEFSSILPIVVSNKLGENSILPALCYEKGLQRDKPIILPPRSYTIASSTGPMESSSSSSSSVNSDKNFMEQLEVDLFKFLIDQINDSDCIYTVSPKYFQGISTNPQQGSRWYDLFSKAGVCTLLSVHKIKYFYQVSGTTVTSIKTSKHDVVLSTILKDSIPLPINHRLQKSIIEALNKQGLTLSIINTPLSDNNTIYLIEDYISPGIDLLLTCIARLQDKLIGKEMAERLSCLLHDNWSSYNPYLYNLKADFVTNYSSWLYKLRETAWLPIESTTLTLSSNQLMCPVDSHMIYSPSAFYQLQLQNSQLFKLLKDTCLIWSPGSYIVNNPLNSQFTKSIGLINQPDRSTFEALMRCLGEKARDNSIDSVHLTPDLMLFIYRTAVQYYLRDVVGDYSRAIDSSMEHSLTDWLRLVFANPTYPCILVQCPNTMITRKLMHKRPRSDTNTTVNTHNNDNVDLSESNVYKCPVCEAMPKSSTSMKAVPGKRRPRSNVDIDISGGSSDELDQSTPVYHLVDIDVVCWESVVIDNNLLNSKYSNDNCSSDLGNNNSVHNTEDVEEDTGEYFNDQCILVNCTTSDGNEQPLIPVKTINRPHSFGQWHKPCDIVTLTSTSTNDGHDDDNTNDPNHQSNKLYLFAWSKPIHARLIHEMNWKQWNAHKDNMDGNNVSFNPMFRIMAHSLNCLNARYTGSNSKMSSFSTKAVFTSTSFLLDQFTPSSVQYYCREGTVHGLLLDLFNLPVIDHVSELFIKHHLHGNTTNYYINPNTSFKTDSFMIPCRTLDMFLKGLVRLILLWWYSTIHSSSNTITHHPNSSENSIDENIVNGILESKEINAFLVDHLQIALSFNDSSSYSNMFFNNHIDLSKRFIGCLLNGKLFLDSTLGANIFANLSQILPDYGTQLIYLLLGSMSDPLLKCSVGFDSIDNSLLSQIIDFICPYGGPKKISLTQFIQGFINLALSMQTDITVFINQPHFNSTFLSQLENYLVSHGVKQRKARYELHLLCPPLLPISSTLTTSKVVESYQNNQITNLSVSSNSTNSTDIVQTNQSINNNQQLISVNSSFEVIPPKSSTYTTTTQSTRYDTTLSAMQAIGAATTPFIRLSKETSQSIDRVHCTTTFWSNDENTIIPENLTTRLNRMLVNTTDKSTNIGRIGELYIYHILLDYIHRTQNHHSNFDEITSCEFPTGHPLLGVGRLIRCNWCNSDVESMRPYDLEVDVQVECDANKWDRLIGNLKDEINNNIVRIIRRPSQQQDAASSGTSGLLSVGPIFIEVKSTVDSTNLQSNNSETNLNLGTDLFEFSLPEILCASQQGWRYHLLRVIWKNDPSQDFCQMRIGSAPKVIHIPDLSNVLRQKSVNIRLCLALLRSEWIK